MPDHNEKPPFIKRREEQLKAQNPQTPNKRSKLHKFVDWLNDWHVTRLFQAIGSFLLLLTIVGFYFDYEDRKQSRIVDAWQLITTKAPGNSGKIEALEFLNSIGQPLTGINLSSEKAKDDTDGEKSVYLKGINLSKANLKKSNFSNADLSNADLSNSNLSNTNFSYTNLSSANLSNTYSNDVAPNIVDRILHPTFNIDFSYANLQSAILTHSSHIEADFEETDLTYSNLKNSNFTRSYFSFTDLTGADLSGSNLTGSYFGTADLKKANLSDTNLSDVYFKNSNLEYTNFLRVKGLTCEQLIEAVNWQSAYRDYQLACGANLPVKPW